jgi:hypothetical protein
LIFLHILPGQPEAVLEQIAARNQAEMKILKKLFIAAAVLVLASVIGIIAAGLLLPSSRNFTNEIDIDAPAERVWQVVTDKHRYTEWQTQLDRVELIDDKNWIEYPKNAPEPLRFRLLTDARPQSMEFYYTMGDSIHGYWGGEIETTMTGVRLKTVDSYKTDDWLMKILMGAFFDLDGFAKDWNIKLKQRAEALNH